MNTPNLQKAVPVLSLRRLVSAGFLALVISAVGLFAP